jgi:hypothetical protein
MSQGGDGLYGYGGEQLMQMLLPYLSGNNKTDKATLGVQASSTNNVQDLVKLMMDPSFGALTGAYDPLALPQQPQRVTYTHNLPLYNSFANSADPTAQQVANGLMSGQLDPWSAKRLVTEAANDKNSPLFGMDPLTLSGTIDDMVKEMGADQKAFADHEAEQDKIQNAATKEDVFTKAGLPSPLDVYDATNSQITERSAKMHGQQQSRIDNTQRALDQYNAANPQHSMTLAE